MVEQVQTAFNISQRRVCKATGQARSSQRYKPADRDLDKPLIKRMHELAQEHPRYGYRRIRALLTEEGYRVNLKRVNRLWRQEGLKVPQKQVKKRNKGSSKNSIKLKKAEYKDHVWTYDFVTDQTEDGRAFRVLCIMDEYTRENLKLKVSRSITSQEVVEILGYLFAKRGAPKYIRSDNGPEFVANVVKQFLLDEHVDTLFIKPGSPWENAYIESFNSRFRDELLDRELFMSLKLTKVIIEYYQNEYNYNRPHSSLGYVAPAHFAASLVGSAVGAAPLPTNQPANNPPTLMTTGT